MRTKPFETTKGLVFLLHSFRRQGKALGLLGFLGVWLVWDVGRIDHISWGTSFIHKWSRVGNI